jgi:hypothetical protein
VTGMTALPDTLTDDLLAGFATWLLVERGHCDRLLYAEVRDYLFDWLLEQQQTGVKRADELVATFDRYVYDRLLALIETTTAGQPTGGA